LKYLLTLLLYVPLLSVAEEHIPPEIAVVEMGAGRLFVNSEGLTLYTFKRDREQPGTSLCVDDCALQWPPALAPEDAVELGDWTVIDRANGTQQWAYKASPVYTYVKDTHAGAMIGEKASGFWTVLFEPISTPPVVAIQGTRIGQTLVDFDGRTLFTNNSESCADDCLSDWRPLEAAWMAISNDSEWTITTHDNGLRQWTYKQELLFTYAGDNEARALKGRRADQGWQVAVLQDAPALPDWVTFQETDFGAVFADENRMTLYSLVSDPEKIARETCDAQCEQDNWRPVRTSAETAPVGNWSTRLLADGQYQWTYLGVPVYTYLHDGIPGDTRGNKFGAGAGVRGGWMAILTDTLAQQLP
jgi:predicted lipoprotein with Yx(FWY)xxD motif